MSVFPAVLAVMALLGIVATAIVHACSVAGMVLPTDVVMLVLFHGAVIVFVPVLCLMLFDTVRGRPYPRFNRWCGGTLVALFAYALVNAHLAGRQLEGSVVRRPSFPDALKNPEHAAAATRHASGNALFLYFLALTCVVCRKRTEPAP